MRPWLGGAAEMLLVPLVGLVLGAADDGRMKRPGWGPGRRIFGAGSQEDEAQNTT